MTVLLVQNHCNLVTVGELHAIDAISPDFLRQFGFVHDSETEQTEEFRLVGKTEHSLYPQFAGFIETGPHQPGADPVPGSLFQYRNRPQLGEVLPHDMECAGAYELPFLLEDIEVAHRLIKFGQGAGQHVTTAGVMGKELLNALYVFQLCFAQHNVSFLRTGVDITAQEVPSSNISRACSRVFSVIFAPPSILAISLTLASAESSTIPVVVRPEREDFSTLK